MFEFKKICDTFERLSSLERRQLLEEKSGSVFPKLQSCSPPPPESDPKEILAGFLIGSTMINGKLNEMEYPLMYPSLVRTFGEDFDFRSLKENFRRNRGGKKLVGDYAEKVLGILRFSEEVLKRDVVILCLCATSMDGKISLKEKKVHSPPLGSVGIQRRQLVFLSLIITLLLFICAGFSLCGLSMYGFSLCGVSTYGFYKKDHIPMAGRSSE